MQKDSKSQVVPPSFRGILAGTASGVAKLVVGHPFDTLKVRLQTEGGYGRFNGPLHCLTSTIKEEGFRALYKGATPPLFGWGLIDSIMVGTYAWARRVMQNNTEPLSIAKVSLAGTIGGLASCVVVTPIEQIKGRLQVQYVDPATKVYSGPIDCVRKIYKANGIAGLYQGFWGTVMFRIFCGLYFGSYEYFSRKMTHSPITSPIPKWMQNFVCGGLAATSLWCAAFPFDVIKNRMMTQPLTNQPYKTVYQCVQKIYAKEGMKGFYRGFTPCILRSFPANGAAFVAIEITLKYLP